MRIKTESQGFYHRDRFRLLPLGRPKMRRQTGVLAAFLIGVAVPLPAGAVLYTQDMIFQTENQSIWSDTDTAFRPFNFDESWGKSWDETSTVGRIETATIAGHDFESGVSFTAASKGKVEMKVNAFLESGTVDISYPRRFTFEYPERVEPGERFSLGISHSRPPLFGSPRMEIDGPTAGASVDLVTELSAKLSGRACAVVGCEKATLINIDFKPTLELAAFGPNQQGDVQLRLLGVPAPLFGKEFNIASGTASLRVDLPNLDAQSNPFTTGDTIRAAAEDDVFTFLLDVDDLLLFFVPFAPPLEVDFSHYTGFQVEGAVFDAEVGPQFGIRQEFEFDPRFLVELEFDREVMVPFRTNILKKEILVPVTKLSIPLLDSGYQEMIDLVMPDDGFPLSVTPTFKIAPVFRNKTDFWVQGFFKAEALSVSVDPPLVDTVWEVGPVWKVEDDFLRSTIFTELDILELGGFEPLLGDGLVVMPTGAAFISGEDPGASAPGAGPGSVGMVTEPETRTLFMIGMLLTILIQRRRDRQTDFCPKCVS